MKFPFKMNEVLVGNSVLDSPSPVRAETQFSNQCEAAKVTEKVNTSSDEELDVFSFKTRTRMIMSSENDHFEGANKKEEHFDNSTVASENNLTSLNAYDSSSGDDLNIFKRKPLKTKITDKSFSSDNEGLFNKQSPKKSPKKDEDSRIQSKQNNMKAKFNNLLLSRDKNRRYNSKRKVVKTLSCDSSDDESCSETFSIENIKKKIEERNKTLKSTIYDPDTSDDEKAHVQEENEKNGFRYKKKSLPKDAVRMSAKQAMENMQKIKSESNRMLREKEVSLPYHRPKALSLKDILARKKPATSVDGTAFSIKMNDKQLQEYAKMLEERQRLMMELCKSDSDGDEEAEYEDNLIKKQSKNYTSEINDMKSQANNENNEDLANDSTSNVKNNLEGSEAHKDEEKMDISAANDELFNSQASEVNTLITDNNDKEIDGSDPSINTVNARDHVLSKNTEVDSQLISLHYSESENFDSNPVLECQDNEQGTTNLNNELEAECQNNKPGTEINIMTEIANKASLETTDTNVAHKECEKVIYNEKGSEDIIEISINDDISVSKESAKPDEEYQDDAFNDFLDDDEMNMDEIDRMIEDAEILENTNNDMTDSPMLIRDPYNPRLKPKLTGAPGMLIDLDGTDPTGPKKMSGIELLKQRFVYFTNLKTPEELQKQARNRINPGLKHQKLKHELEEQIAEQRSIEWTKRLEEEKQQQAELNAIRGDDSDADYEEDIDKLDAKLEKDDVAEESEPETEPEENDVEIKDKPRKRNALVDDEAEESEGEEVEGQAPQAEANNEVMEESMIEDDNEADVESVDELSDDESSSDDEMETSKPKKGRIIKAFEDSDEEEVTELKSDTDNIVKDDTKIIKNLDTEPIAEERNINGSMDKSLNEDDDLQSAQLQKSISEDIFTSQDTETVNNAPSDGEVNKNINVTDTLKKSDDKLAVICETQPFDEGKFDDIVGMCSGSFSQNIITTQAIESTQINEPSLINTDLHGDLLDLCTGKFYDNQFVSQVQEHSEGTKDNLVTKDPDVEEFVNKDTDIDNLTSKEPEILELLSDKLASVKETPKDDNLQSILEELNDPEFDKPKQNKFFTGSLSAGNTDNSQSNLSKKRFVIDSDDEDEVNKSEIKAKKRKKKLEQRALQISDEEESDLEERVEDEYESALEDIDEDNADRLVEYDSEENEVVIPISSKNLTKKKSKARDFFEQEAELTSEDEWVGSGDEDEAGLDRMEREEGDDEHFHQDALQKQLGKIHMRDMLDQDKREVRMIQELLLEDGDLGGGHRQRKFRWRNADGGEEGMGSYIEDMASTQEMEEEIESEEQWRRQSHERAMYLRQIMSQQKDADLDDVAESSFNQSASSAKANATSENVAVTNENAVVLGKKPSKDIPSPAKKPFALLQHNSRGSILSRGDGALARLAALATPLAGESSEDGPKATSLGPLSKRNFVFATVSPSAADKPKMTKRKAENIGTPNLMKKLKTDEKPSRSAKISLLDHLKG